MPVAAVAAVGVAVSASSARSSRRDANRNAQRQSDVQQQQVDLQREQMDFERQRYDEWHDMFWPVLGDLRNEVYKEQRVDYAGIDADVANAFDTSEGIARRNAMRYGMNPADGAFAAAQGNYGLARAKSTVDARNRARIANKDVKFNRLASFYGAGNGIMGSATAGMQQSAAALGNAYGGQAQTYGMNAALHGQAAAAATSQMMQYGMQFAGAFGGGGGGTSSMPGYGPSYGYPGSPGSGPWGSTQWPGG